MSLPDQGFASPYSTGGGGTTLEHAYGAALLSSLLLKHPVFGLGDEFTPREVRFQQGATSFVDDLVVVGDCPPTDRTLYIGVRRAPTIAGGNSSFVTLLVDYLRMVLDHQNGLDRGYERLGLAVAAPHTGAHQVAKLAALARRQPDDIRFRQAVAAPRATDAKVRGRLQNLDDAVTAAAAQAGIAFLDAAERDALTWRLLKALRVIELRLEGDDQADRTNVVSRLVPLTGDARRAVAVWRRLLELAPEYAQTAAIVDYQMLIRDVSTVVQIADHHGSPSNAFQRAERDDEAYERLRQLPAVCGPRLLSAWRDDPVVAWRLITAVTTVEGRPGDILQQWQASMPAWLQGASWQVQLAAGEVAVSYGAGVLAAELFTQACQQGAPRAAFWLAQAAMLYDESGSDDGRKTALSSLISLPTGREPFASAVTQMLAGNTRAALRIADDWQPQEPSERWLRAVLRLRLAEPGPDESLDRNNLDHGLRVLAEVLREQWTAGLALARAKLLVLRARRGESPNWDADLREARTQATRARDDRRTYRANSAEAVAVACEANMMLMDLPRVITLGTPDGEATTHEAESPDVCQRVAIAAIHLGRLDLARQRADYVPNGPARARIDGYLAQASGQNPEPHFWRAAELAGDDDEQLAQSLRGLAQCGVDGLARFPEFAHRHPHEAAELRAMADLAAGNTDAAILQLRDRRRSSISAALSLAQAYQVRGEIDDQVQTLRDAADDFGDQSLRQTAAEVLARAGRTADAQKELDTLLSAQEPDWTGRGEALRLAAQLASDSKQFDRACQLLRTLVQIDPDDTASRWALIRILLHRGVVKEAWRALHDAPAPLDPSNTTDARAWVQLHRRRGQPLETMSGFLRLLRRFNDDEQFVAFVLTNAILPWPQPVDLPEALKLQLAAESEQFFQRWPGSPHLRRVQASDQDQLRDQVVAMSRVSDDHRLTWRRLLHGLSHRRVPLAMVASAASSSYAEVCIRRGDGVLCAHLPDPGEFASCVDAAHQAEDRDIVIDTPAAVVLLALTEDVRRAAMSRFSRVMTTDDVMVDVLAAKDILALRGTTTVGYDEQHDHLVGDQSTEEQADRLAQEAEDLHDLVEGLIRRTSPPAETLTDAQVPAPLRTWASTLDLARSQGAVLWSDDPVLRALARGTGVPTTSTTAIMHQLLVAGSITEDQHETFIRAMIKARIGQLPLHEQRLWELAEDDAWRPGTVAMALARPASWADPLRTLALYRRLLPQIRAHAPHTLAQWHYALVRGATTVLSRPDQATGVAACLLATAIEYAATQAARVAHLVATTRRALLDTDGPDEPPAVDPLPIAVKMLWDAYSRALSHELAGRFMLATFAALDPTDRGTVLRIVLE